MTSKNALILIVIVFILILAVLFCARPPQPPIPTETPVVTSVITENPYPVETETPIPSPQVTEIVVTETLVPPTATPKPPKTPPIPKITPMVEVRTGYKFGWLHYRYGPSTTYLPQWGKKLGAVPEGTKLVFVSCAETKFPWVKVLYREIPGYVYGKFVFPNPCE